MKKDFASLSLSDLESKYKGTITIKVYSSNNIGEPILVDTQPYTYTAPTSAAKKSKSNLATMIF